MRFLLLLSMLLSACVDRGTLLDIPPSAETQAAIYYDVFWFNESTAPDGKKQTCVGFEGPGGAPVEYVERLTDAQIGDGPQTLPADFKTNGVQLLISGDRHSRVAIALLDANLQLVGVATYPSDIQVTTGENRRYQLTTQATAVATGAPPTGEWRAAVTTPGHERNSVLRFAATDFEYRIAPNFDFDGDDFQVATSANCPTSQNRSTTLDCNDLSAAVKPQPGIADATCGKAEPDIDCQFNGKPIELCAAPVGAANCTFGLLACGDGGAGLCTPTQSTILFPAASPFCAAASNVTQINCVVHRGIACRDLNTQPIDTRLSLTTGVCNIALLTAPVLPGGRDIEFKTNGTVLSHNGAAAVLSECKFDTHLQSINDQSGYMYVALKVGDTDPRMFKVHFTEDCDSAFPSGITCDPFSL